MFNFFSLREMFDINSCVYKAIDNKFGYIEFNDLILFVSADLQWFCATRFCTELKYNRLIIENDTAKELKKKYVSAQSQANHWWNKTMKKKFDESFPGMYKRVDGK